MGILAVAIIAFWKKICYVNKKQTLSDLLSFRDSLGFPWQISNSDKESRIMKETYNQTCLMLHADGLIVILYCLSFVWYSTFSQFVFWVFIF